MTDFELKVIKLLNIQEEDDPRIEKWMEDFWAKYMLVNIPDSICPVIVPRATYDASDLKANEHYYKTFMEEILK